MNKKKARRVVLRLCDQKVKFDAYYILRANKIKKPCATLIEGSADF